MQTVDLVLSLQLEDLEELNKSAKGDIDNVGYTDVRMAQDLYCDYLRNYAVVISDRRLGAKVGEGGGTGSRSPSPVPSATPKFDQVLANSVSHLAIETSQAEVEPPILKDECSVTYDCVICRESRPKSQLINAPCGDHYCEVCACTLFGLAVKDESLFPARCCRLPIPLEPAAPFLTPALIQEVKNKTIEFETTNRTYCHVKYCAAFIVPSAIDGERATCAGCDSVTCAVCKAAAHEGDCPKNPAYEALMEHATAAG